MLSFRKNGQSLVEAVVALALFLVVISGSVVVSSRYLDTTIRANDLNEVQIIARESLEAVQSIAYNDWVDMVDGQYGLENQLTGSWEFQGTPDIVKDRYTRTVSVSAVERDIDCQIVGGGGSADEDTKLVTVVIAWGPSMAPMSRAFTQYFTNWKNPTPCISPVFFYAIHGNADVNMQGTTGVVNGDINTGGNINQGSVVVNGNMYDSSPITAPTVDFAAYQAIADHYVSGNYKFKAGTYSGIWYINGNATIDSSVAFNGTIVATGNIRFVGSASTSFNPTGAYPALIAQGNIEGNNAASVAINGIAFASGNMIISSSASVAVYGSLVANGNLEIKNSASLSVTYDPTIPNNPPPYFD